MKTPRKSGKQQPARSFLDGQILIAMPAMSDERFARAVIYVCAHSSEGAMGIVVVCMHGRLWVSVVAAVSSALAVVVAFKDIADVNGFANSNGLDPSAVTVGPGLWFTLLAALVALTFAFVGIAKREAPTGDRVRAD